MREDITRKRRLRGKGRRFLETNRLGGQIKAQDNRSFAAKQHRARRPELFRRRS